MNRMSAVAIAGCLLLPSVPPAYAACGVDIATAVRSGGAQDFSNLRSQVSRTADGQIVDVSLCDEGARLVYRVLVVPRVANAQTQLLRVDAKSGAVLK